MRWCAKSDKYQIYGDEQSIQNDQIIVCFNSRKSGRQCSTGQSVIINEGTSCEKRKLIHTSYIKCIVDQVSPDVLYT